jgi:hypothetical protein
VLFLVVTLLGFWGIGSSFVVLVVMVLVAMN